MFHIMSQNVLRIKMWEFIKEEYYVKFQKQVIKHKGKNSSRMLVNNNNNKNK